MKRITFLTLALLLAFLVACGGGGGSSNPAPADRRSSRPRTASSSRSSSAPRSTASRRPRPAFRSTARIVHAAVDVVLSQSFHGVCNFAPNTTGDAVALLYGLGQNGAPGQPGINCSSSWFTSTPELAAASGNAGQVIIGDGTLADLTCWTTEGTAAPAGITAQIFLLRAGAIVDTGMTCPLTGNDYIKNQSSATFRRSMATAPSSPPASPPATCGSTSTWSSTSSKW
jgi:hypothetical protein